MKCRFLVAAALFAVACSGKADVIYGQNLVVNGDAEAGVSGWSGYTGYNMVQSVDYGNNWVLPTQPGPVDRGTKMFAGLGQYAVGTQTLDFGVPTARNSAYTLSGWLGGWAAQGDNALFYVQFLDAANNEIGNAAIGPVTPQDRGNQTGLYYRESVGIMPAGTSKLSFWLSMERLASNDNDGYADNLSFITTSPVPEPGMVSMFVLGLGMLAGAARRNKRAHMS
ncbi:PEP-CTERM sorting domain-containing protein [Duganella sp. BJB488]|uniref:PEP-CTERM sorting domain-containing protein n=1 Tax=unclassified Duganella TaxID=2636909 RepID=UPI000E34FC70|nr:MULTISPECIES: PEP-CTERM sorting domain-containing protein [unclassified Duganella]RFP09418.1 PEP-CTERM sorting domain-containing protein [Duganella sp. BJB489]RFP13060.1 PEP-CTERM sorting domain-containing protein [Duganella sp. BJB488]RFP29212.1 PEP-CTERM sorting domain-containing protein [Duganella sp. BJB480]